MYADKSKEIFADETAPRKRIEIDRLCPSITQAVKDYPSAYVIISYPLLSLQDAAQSAMKNVLTPKEAKYEKG